MSYILSSLSETLTSKGYWEPHSSSVDFCEINYYLSYYIAEFHNVWSSLLISLLGIIGILYSNPLNEKRYNLMFITLILIGLGSVGLHLSLHWFGQSLDELFMLYMNLTIIYSLYRLNINKSNYIIINSLLFVGIIQTICYFVYREIYYLFLFSFGITTFISVIWTNYIMFQDCSQNDYNIRKNLYFSSLFSFIFGLSLWVYEMNNCSNLLKYYIQLYGITLHIIWHIGSGLGCYYQILLLITIHLQNLGYNIIIDYIFYIIPIIKINGMKVLMS